MSDLDTKTKNQNLMTYGPLVKDYEQKMGYDYVCYRFS